MKMAPCKGCSNRYVGCHGECASYIDWQQQQEVRRRNAHKDEDYLEYQRQAHAKRFKKYYR